MRRETGQTIDLSPANWPAADLDKFSKIQYREMPGNPVAEGVNGAITGAYNGMAQRAGLEALKQGGSAVDAALTTAMAQITLDAGAAVSFAGIMTLIHYEAATGEISFMNAAWNTVKGEIEPMTIPGITDVTSEKGMLGGTASGRTALVPGFMKGVAAAHNRFGKLPFETLFKPSIYFAEKGFNVYPEMAAQLEKRTQDLMRLPETRAVFTKENGDIYQEGDLFKQPALAKTLRAIADHGVDYMYNGPWAEKLVAAVQAEGGNMTLDDLASYDVIWTAPYTGRYKGYDIHTSAGPGMGGANLIEALNLAKASNLTSFGHWSVSPEAFKRLVQITSAANLNYLSREAKADMFPDLDLSLESRLKKETAEKLWKRMGQGITIGKYLMKNNHSDDVVAVDRRGNMAAVCHSINCVFWGKTGIFVDGVSISDAASFQQPLIAAAGPGNRLPDPTCVGLLAKDEKPMLAFSSMGMGLHYKTVQSLLNIVDFKMTLKEAIDAPCLLFPLVMNMETSESKIRVAEGDFDATLLDAIGYDYVLVSTDQVRLAEGIWVAVQRDPETGRLTAASSRYNNGWALAL